MFLLACRTHLCDPAFANTSARINEIPTKAFAATVSRNITDVRNHYTPLQVNSRRIGPYSSPYLLQSFVRYTRRLRHGKPILFLVSGFPNSHDSKESHFDSRQERDGSGNNVYRELGLWVTSYGSRNGNPS